MPNKQLQADQCSQSLQGNESDWNGNSDHHIVRFVQWQREVSALWEDKEPLTNLASSVEVTIELVFEEEVDFSQVKSGGRRAWTEVSLLERGSQGWSGGEGQRCTAASLGKAWCVGLRTLEFRFTWRDREVANRTSLTIFKICNFLNFVFQDGPLSYLIFPPIILKYRDYVNVGITYMYLAKLCILNVSYTTKPIYWEFL